MVASGTLTRVLECARVVALAATSLLLVAHNNPETEVDEDECTIAAAQVATFTVQGTCGEGTLTVSAPEGDCHVTVVSQSEGLPFPAKGSRESARWGDMTLGEWELFLAEKEGGDAQLLCSMADARGGAIEFACYKNCGSPCERFCEGTLVPVESGDAP